MPLDRLFAGRIKLELGVSSTILPVPSSVTTIDIVNNVQGDDEMPSRTVTLTDAQIKSIPTSPIEIVPAPGVGKMILPIAGHVTFDMHGNYSADSTPALTLKWGTVPIEDASDYIGSQTFLTTITLLASQVGIFMHKLSTGTGDYLNHFFTTEQPTTAVDNLALMLFDDDNDGGPDYTGGHASNTLKITLFYVVVDL